MHSRKYTTLGLALILALVTAPSGSANRQGSHAQSNYGIAFGTADPACRIKDFNPIGSLTPLYASNGDSNHAFHGYCEFLAEKDGAGVKGATARTVVNLYVINNTGWVDTTRVATRRFRTNQQGRDRVDFDIDPSLIPNEFYTGDAWVYYSAVTTGKNNKKVDLIGQSCYYGTGDSENVVWK